MSDFRIEAASNIPSQQQTLTPTHYDGRPDLLAQLVIRSLNLRSPERPLESGFDPRREQRVSITPHTNRVEIPWGEPRNLK